MSTATFSTVRAIRLTVLSLGALVFLSPYIFMLSAAGKTQSEIFTSALSLVPQTFYYVANFTKAFSRVPMGTLLWNGVSFAA